MTSVPTTPPPTYQPTILQTRLHPPQLPADVTPRPRLDVLVQRGVAHKLLLVTAPAGYGKTTAVLLWAQQQPLPVGWLSLNAAQDELSTFMTYLVAAIQRAAPGACANTALLVQAGQAPAAVLLAALVNELAALEHPLMLVLDDYGSVANKTVHEFVTALIDDQPPTLHLVMTTRASPPLPLARWRASHDLAEIRAADLRCAEDETAALLTALLGAPAPAAVAETIHARTEGWVTGLRLAALSLQRTDPAQLIAALTRASTVNLRDYLLDEVLSRQPAAVQDFLLKTAVLERFCAPLCAALLTGDREAQTAIGAARTMIDHLTKAGLFVTALDEAGEWHRYHHLFAELLRHRLHSLHGEQVAGELQRTAGQWFASQGLVEEAIHHLLAGGDAQGAAKVVASHAQLVLNREDWPQLERWLALLPAAVVSGHPMLLLARTWCMQFWFILAAIPALLTQVETLPLSADSANVAVIAGQIAVHRSQLALYQGDIEAVLIYAENGLALVQEEDRYVRSLAVFYRALALQMAGRSEEAESWLLDLLRSAHGHVDAFTIRLQFALCTNYRMSGELDRLRATAARMLADAQQQQFPLGKGWAHLFLGYAAYETNDLATAEFHFAAGVQLMFVAHGAAVRDCLFGLALTPMAQRRLTAAARAVEQLRNFRHGLDAEIDSLAARLALVQGDVHTAARWALSFRPGPSQPFLHWQEVPCLSAARILVATEKPDHLQLALDLLQPTVEWAERSHSVWRVVECSVLRAAVLAGLGREKAADEALHTALMLGQTAGYQRIFLDLGPPLHGLLARQKRYKALAPYARRLLRALADEPGLRAPATAHTGVEPLTAREREVLRLLAQRLSNKEIAQALTIAPNTVKRHTLQIFAKLGVNDRRAAVEQARRSGLLNDEL